MISMDLMTPTAVAAYCHVAPQTVVLWANKGKLQALRTTTGRRLFLRADVERLKAQREAKAEAA